MAPTAGPANPGVSRFATPIPQRFYIHDDLSAEVRHTHGPGSVAAHLTQALLTLVRRDAQRVVVLHLDEQITAVVRQAQHAPFAMTIGIGQAGMRVAQQLHQQTGWFPVRRQIALTREENEAGGYTLVSPGGPALSEQLQDLPQNTTLAVVDDTVFSGLTMRGVLTSLPPAVLHHTQAFCLRGVAESLPSIRALCPLTIGFAAPGRLLDDVSFINAAGLVRRISIRRAGQASLAFFERPEWMQAWFPGYAQEVIDLCHRLNRLLEPES